MKSVGLRSLIACAGLLTILCAVPKNGAAGELCGIGTGGWGCGGPGVANLQGVGNVSITNLGVNFVLADGLAVSFNINESITGNLGGGATTSAYLRITNLVAQDIGLGAVNDNVYIFSDVFNPAVAGTAGVGAVGYYGASAPGLLPAAGVYAASSQAQMNYLLAPLLLPGVAPGFSLTTPSTFAVGAPAVPFFFFEAARANIGGGTVQLVGGLNFQLTSGSEIAMPGSLIIDDNDPSQIDAEVPEPMTLSLMGCGMLALAFAGRRFRK
jgi:hypothetical protein